MPILDSFSSNLRVLINDVFTIFYDITYPVEFKLNGQEKYRTLNIYYFSNIGNNSSGSVGFGPTTF